MQPEANEPLASLRSAAINTEVYEEPYIFSDAVVTPKVVINSLSLTFIEDQPAELQIKNDGDCLVQVELRNKDLRTIKKQIGAGQHDGYDSELQAALSAHQGTRVISNPTSPVGRSPANGSKIFSF